MTGRPLSDAEVERLRGAPFTYSDVGSTRTGAMPDGYGVLLRSVVVGSGPERFERASQAVLRWDMHRRAGLTVRPSNDPVALGTVAVVRLGPGPLGLDAPVRVVYLVDEPRRQGFAYGTLPGHPERGEEAFVVELQADGSVTFTITAFSRPATLVARLTGPVGRRIQSLVTNRYLRAV
ncbi:DUF1990 domain-containing protein [Nocardioides KLBMP 9356]|uniref:DUF1990 domain-containing protein n=1 Tax=Nocardioides potassii TaxID=2911371 RepID=A0ABS9HA41_9ACTN|nr:DUF1990 domain-containing protein [Nocardioides potassii]MCF6377364.1 DUF1990 domain-containing protein [Nocardioides potassii]